MSDTTYAYQAGYDAGKALLEPGPSLNAALAKGEEDQLARQAPARRELVTRRAQLRSAEAGLAPAAAREAKAQTRHEELRRQADAHPARYSAFRGVMYLAVALVIFGAEFTLLSQILSQVMNLSGFVKGARGVWIGPASALMTLDWPKIKQLGELFLATAGVLGLPVAVKAVLDREAGTGEPGSKSRRIGLANVVVALVMLTIVGTAFARLVLNFGGSQAAAPTGAAQYAIRIVATIIGLACPFAALLLFTSGWDAISRRLKVSIAQWGAYHASRKAARLRARHLESEGALHRAALELELVGAAAEGAGWRMETLEEFRRGFGEGMARTLSDAAEPGGHRRIRSLLASANSTTASQPQVPLTHA